MSSRTGGASAVPQNSDDNDRPPRPSMSRRQFALSLAAGVGAARITSTNPSIARAADVAPDTGFMTPSGLRYFDFVVGDGVKPIWGDYLTIDYAMYTISPSGDSLVRAHSTFPKKDRNLIIHHGNGQTVLGMEEALHSMRVGGRRRIIVPPTLAYVNPGLGPIPPQARARKSFFAALRETGGTVVFDVELLSREPIGDTDPFNYYSDLTPTPQELTDLLDRVRKENITKGVPQFEWDTTLYVPE